MSEPRKPSARELARQRRLQRAQGTEPDNVVPLEAPQRRKPKKRTRVVDAGTDPDVPVKGVGDPFGLRKSKSEQEFLAKHGGHAPGSGYARRKEYKGPRCQDHGPTVRGAPCQSCGKCTSRSTRTGYPCRQFSVEGGPVCVKHGGSAEQVIKAAKLRLIGLTHPAVHALYKVMMHPRTSDGDRLKAALAILDRAGLGPGASVEVTEKKWQGVVGRVVRPTGEKGRSRYADRHYQEDEDEEAEE